MKSGQDNSYAQSLVLARKAYRHLLTRHQLLEFSQQEIDEARASLRTQGCAAATPEDLRFQAAVARLTSRQGASRQIVRGVLQELLNAEYECDQAAWERECDRAATVSHQSFK